MFCDVDDRDQYYERCQIFYGYLVCIGVLCELDEGEVYMIGSNDVG